MGCMGLGLRVASWLDQGQARTRHYTYSHSYRHLHAIIWLCVLPAGGSSPPMNPPVHCWSLWSAICTPFYHIHYSPAQIPAHAPVSPAATSPTNTMPPPAAISIPPLVEYSLFKEADPSEPSREPILADLMMQLLLDQLLAGAMKSAGKGKWVEIVVTLRIYLLVRPLLSSRLWW